jgi:hypothetical protein
VAALIFKVTFVVGMGGGAVGSFCCLKMYREQMLFVYEKCTYGTLANNTSSLNPVIQFSPLMLPYCCHASSYIQIST